MPRARVSRPRAPLTRAPQYILRKAFDIAPDGKPYLPASILWRQKEQFSDGVGYSWIDGSVPIVPLFLTISLTGLSTA